MSLETNKILTKKLRKKSKIKRIKSGLEKIIYDKL